MSRGVKTPALKPKTPSTGRADQRRFPLLILSAIRRSAAFMSARIYQRPKNAMQSGKARTSDWLLEFEPSEAKRPDPLMGWAGSGDTQQQVVLKFETAEDAQAYAARYCIEAHVIPTPVRKLKLQSYADNFR